MEDKILYVSKGSAELLEAHREDSEIFKIKIKGKKKLIYTGVMPIVVYRIRGWLGRKLEMLGFKRPLRERMFLVRDIEPFARDFYTGECADREKMRTVLFQRNVIDDEGYLLNPETKKRFGPKDIDIDKFPDKLFTFEDVSNIEYIQEDTLLLTKAKGVQAAIEAAKKPLVSMRDVMMMIAIIAPLVFILVMTWMLTEAKVWV